MLKDKSIVEIDWKDVFKLMKNINDSWKLDIPELGTVKANISAKDFEKIEYLTYVNEIKQLPTYLSDKKEKKKTQ